MKKICLTIAGSDSSGGAGIQADIKAMEANGVFSMSVITGITAQNSHAIIDEQVLNPAIIKNQIDCLFSDYKIEGVKIGALFNTKIMNVVAESMKKYQPPKIVLDPVMVSKSKNSLLNPNDLQSFINNFSQLDLLLTPNLHEAEAMLKMEIKNEQTMEKAIIALQNLGFTKVLLKGGHLPGDQIIDIFINGRGGSMHKVKSQQIKTKNTHGTGCSLSSAIVALWMQSNDLQQAVNKGIAYVHQGIKSGFNFGEGFGPINHFWKNDHDFKK